MDDRHSNPVRWRLHLYILSTSKSVTNRAHRRAFTCASSVVMKPARNAIDVGLLVSDIEASLAFYVGVLGLPKVQEMQVSFGTLHRLAFGESFVKLIDPSSMPPRGEPGLHGALGLRYITFPITNIDEVCEACRCAGVQFDMPKTEFMPGATIAMVRDPDGNIVEFVQRG